MPLAAARPKENALRITPRETFSQTFAKANTGKTRSDEELLRGMARKEEKALGELFDRYADVMCGIAFHILRDQDTSDDVVQAAFVQVWREADQLIAVKTSLAGCLALTAQELAMDALHCRSRSPQAFPRIAYSTEAVPELTSTTERTRQAMRELPSALRIAVEMAFFDGLGPEETADLTATTASNVAAGIRSSLLTLRKAVQR